jgi:1-acyl-sn-glycerol-3-phosphate acyltransferase
MLTPFIFLGILILTVVLAPIVVVAGMLGVEEKPRGIYQRCMHAWCRGILRLSGVKLVVHDGTRMSENDGHVYIANHVSWFDIFALASIIPRYTWIAKAELRKIPLFGRAAQAAGIVFIERDNRKAAFESYKLAAQQVKRGRSVIICPEGTRGRDYHLRPFKKGPFVLAIAAGAPVVPVFCENTFELMPRGSWSPKPGTVTLKIGAPIPTVGLAYDARDDLARKARAAILEMGARE